MQRDGRDARVASRELGGVEYVGELGLAVADPAAEHEAGHWAVGVEFGEGDAGFGVEAEAHGGGAQDADVGGGGGGGAEEGGEEGVDEHGVGEVVD